MMMNYNQKEVGLLKDMKSQEELCVQKYGKCAKEACDPELKSLFKQIQSQEESHVRMIEDLMAGKIPSIPSSGISSTQSGIGSQSQAGGSMQSESSTDSESYTRDKYLCSDTLDTEKHVSSVYNTSVFEFKTPEVRNILNHIQKEEQEHGEKIYQYMAAHGMYQA